MQNAAALSVLLGRVGGRTKTARVARREIVQPVRSTHRLKLWDRNKVNEK